jgi:acyl-CoA dehydrogenase
MDFELTEGQQAVVDGVAKVCARFDDAYWLARDRDGIFPHEFHRAMADGGWLGITMPEAYGGASLGITETALMMKVVAGSGGGLTAASSIHMNLFGPHAIVVHGGHRGGRGRLGLRGGGAPGCLTRCRGLRGLARSGLGRRAG